MCRYAMYGPYKDIYACFDCRKSYKQRSAVELSEQDVKNRKYLCPQCRKPMANMGHDFKAPKHSDIKQWKKVKILYQEGITYHSCGCGGPGYRPKSLREVNEFLDNRFEPNEGKRILKRIRKITASRKS